MVRSVWLVTVLLVVGHAGEAAANLAEREDGTGANPPSSAASASAGTGGGEGRPAVAPTAPSVPAASPPLTPSPSPSSSSPPSSSFSNGSGAAAGPGASSDSSDLTGGVPMVDAAAQTAAGARYGVGARLRVTSVPKWMLGFLLDESVPLTSYTAGLEFFRRSGNFDLVLGLAYQSLSPSAGNWLGKGNPKDVDTDYIQFDGLAAYSIDAAFILHTNFNAYVGMHYGGGVGIGITTGRMLRTSAGSDGCLTSPGDVTRCHPIVCSVGPCTEAQLAATEGGNDGPRNPSRFSDSHVPTVYPIVNLITGLDIRLPNLPAGVAFKIDLGYFFPYFFAGLGAAYQI